MCCSASQCVAACCIVLQCAEKNCYFVVFRSVLQFVAVCCSVLLKKTRCLHPTSTNCNRRTIYEKIQPVSFVYVNHCITLQHTATHCNTLQQADQLWQDTACVVCVPQHPRQSAGCAQVLQCVAVCCSVLQCAAGCCSVLQCVAVCCSVLQCVAVCCSVLQCVAMCCRVLQCVAVCCSVLQCIAVCCSVLQCVVILFECTHIMFCVCGEFLHKMEPAEFRCVCVCVLQYVTMCCIMLPCVWRAYCSVSVKCVVVSCSVFVW